MFFCIVLFLRKFHTKFSESWLANLAITSICFFARVPAKKNLNRHWAIALLNITCMICVSFLVIKDLTIFVNYSLISQLWNAKSMNQKCSYSRIEGNFLFLVKSKNGLTIHNLNNMGFLDLKVEIARK